MTEDRNSFSIVLSTVCIWSDGFTTRVQDVFRKRGTETPKKPVFCNRNQESADIQEQKTDESEKQDPEQKAEEPEEQDSEEKPKKSIRKPASGEQQNDDGKIKYAEYVRMTEEQYTKLCDDIGKTAADKAIVCSEEIYYLRDKQSRDNRELLDLAADTIDKLQIDLNAMRGASNSFKAAYNKLLDDIKKDPNRIHAKWITSSYGISTAFTCSCCHTSHSLLSTINSFQKV